MGLEKDLVSRVRRSVAAMIEKAEWTDRAALSKWKGFKLDDDEKEDVIERVTLCFLAGTPYEENQRRH